MIQVIKDEWAHFRRAIHAYSISKNYTSAWKTYRQSRISQYGRLQARRNAAQLHRGYKQLAEARPYYKVGEPEQKTYFPDHEYYRVDKDGYLWDENENN